MQKKQFDEVIKLYKDFLFPHWKRQHKIGWHSVKKHTNSIGCFKEKEAYEWAELNSANALMNLSNKLNRTVCRSKIA